ncbi:hypothetical protein V6N13_101513 [Hibiscus sabdariffa]
MRVLVWWSFSMDWNGHVDRKEAVKVGSQIGLWNREGQRESEIVTVSMDKGSCLLWDEDSQSKVLGNYEEEVEAEDMRKKEGGLMCKGDQDVVAIVIETSRKGQILHTRNRASRGECWCWGNIL